MYLFFDRKLNYLDLYLGRRFVDSFLLNCYCNDFVYLFKQKNIIPLLIPITIPMAAGDKKGWCPSFTICRVIYKEQSGNGTIYDCEYPKGTVRILYITSFLEISNVNEITDVYLVFEDKTIGNQYLTSDWVKYLWTSPVDKYNVTVIEFSPTALKVLSRTKYEPLTPDVSVENEDVSVFQYCKQSLNFSNWRIIKVIGEVIEYSLDTEELSCRSPLLNEN